MKSRARIGERDRIMIDWMDVEMMKDAAVMIVDIGYVTDESARNRADEVFALGIGRANLRWAPSTGDPRIHILIPKTKQSKAREMLTISDEKTWFGATHSFTGKDRRKD